MSYRILPTKRFKTRLESALTYISLDLANPIAAKTLLDAVKNTFSLLANTPFAFPEEEDVRKVPVRNYRIYYTVDEQNQIVYPQTFVHSSQDTARLDFDEPIN